MIIKALEDENFTNYKVPVMFVGMPSCTFKCCIEQGLPLSTCQNCDLYRSENKDIEINRIINRYNSNPISQGICFGGLEPMDSWNDLQSFVCEFRKESSDPIIIYTGYREDELVEKVDYLSKFENIIIKFGRYIPNHTAHYDENLGIYLASDNQYAKKIS